MSHSESGYDHRFAVVDQDLVVGVLSLKCETDVGRRLANRRVLHDDPHQHLTGIGDVWRNTESNTGFFKSDRRNVGKAACSPTRACRTRVDYTNRRALTNENLCLGIVCRRNQRLRLQIGQLHFLQRFDERREVEVTDRGREDELQRGTW